MKTKLYTIICSLAVTFFAGCKTASKLYEKGDYDGAVELAAKKLQKDPDDKKLLDIIQNSYQFAVNDHESRITSYMNSTNDLKWEWIYNEYSALQSMYDAIRKSPEIVNIVNPIDYSSDLITYSEKAADARYDRGISLMQNNDKLSYQNAYHEFGTALQYKPGDLDIQSKMDEAYQFAITNVVVLPLEQYSGFQYSSYNYNYNDLDDQLIRNLQLNSGNEFVKFYSSGEAASKNIHADQYVDLQFIDINIGRVRDEKNTREVSKDVVMKETTFRPDSVIKVYGKVTAKITTIKRNMQSDGDMQVVIRDDSGRPLWSNSFHGDYNWNTEFATYSGDERALSDNDKQLINRKQQSVPERENIIRSITGQISSNLWYGVRNYYVSFQG